MTEKRTAGHRDDAWMQVDETGAPGFFIRFLDASRVRAMEFARSRPEAAFAHLALQPVLLRQFCRRAESQEVGRWPLSRLMNAAHQNARPMAK